MRVDPSLSRGKRSSMQSGEVYIVAGKEQVWPRYGKDMAKECPR